MERFTLSSDYVVLGWNLNSPKCIFQGTTPRHVCYRRGDRKHGRSPNPGLHSWVSGRRGDLIATCSYVPNPNNRPDNCEMTIQTAPWKYYIWSESPGSELWWEQIQRHRNFTQTGLSQQTNCIIQRKCSHCWQAVMLFIQFNRAMSSQTCLVLQ